MIARLSSHPLNDVRFTVLGDPSAPDDLGESPWWDVAAQRLRWIDAWRTRINSVDLATGAIERTELTTALAGLPIGAIGGSDDGGLVVSVRGALFHVDLAAASARRLATVEADRPPGNRLNDGKCDRRGRFWCASVNIDHKTPTGALWRFETGKAPVLMRDGLIVGNGIAFSPDDRYLYLADTSAGTVWRYDFDLDSGDIANPCRFIAGDHILGGFDGATVDADGCYWTALFRGWAVAQFDPDGKLMRHVHLPIATPTMCSFGGPDLDVLFVTSATRFLDDAQRQSQPLAGCLLAIEGLRTRGLPEPKFHV